MFEEILGHHLRTLDIFGKLISFWVIWTFTLIPPPMQNQHSRRILSELSLSSFSQYFFIALIITPICFVQKVANVFDRYRSLGGNLNCNLVTDGKADWLEIDSILSQEILSQETANIVIKYCGSLFVFSSLIEMFTKVEGWQTTYYVYGELFIVEIFLAKIISRTRAKPSSSFK